MGSYEAACITGFLCRLCSEMHRSVIHIYGEQGQRQQIAKKINNYLPVTVSQTFPDYIPNDYLINNAYTPFQLSPSDPLPKTICATCLDRVEQHHQLMKKLKRNTAAFAAAAALAKKCRTDAKCNRNTNNNVRHQMTTRVAAAAAQVALSELNAIVSGLSYDATTSATASTSTTVTEPRPTELDPGRSATAMDSDVSVSGASPEQ